MRYIPALYLGGWIHDSLSAAGVDARLQVQHKGTDDHLRVRLSGEG